MFCCKQNISTANKFNRSLILILKLTMQRFKLKRSDRSLSCSCFICLEPVKTRGFNGEQLTSLNFLFNYLKIGNKVGSVVCEKCGVNLVKFMKLGRTLEKVRLEMDYLLGVIQLAISKSNGGIKRAPVVLISVRECVSKKCGEKTWNPRPEIILDRVDASTLLRTQSQTSKKFLIKKDEEKTPKIVLQRCDHFMAIKSTHQTAISDCSQDCALDNGLGLFARDSDIGYLSAVTIPNGKTRRIRCPKCFETFSSKEILRQHLYVVHLHLKPFKCSTCSKSFSSETALRIHLDAAHVAAQVPESVVKKCAEKVLESVLQKADVTEQQTTIPDDSDDWVPNWDEDFSASELVLPPNESDILEGSAASEINEINLENKLADAAVRKAKTIRAKCFKTFSSRPLMKRHFNAIHLHLKTKKFCDKKKSRVHMRNAQTEKSIPCNICKKMFKTQILLRSHVFTVHEKRAGNQDHHYKSDMQNTYQETSTSLDSGYSEKLENGKSVFECDHCRKKVKSVSAVKYHIKAVHGPFRCPDCDFTTDAMIGLTGHSKIHKEQQGTRRRQVRKRARAKCDKCSKTFCNKTYLKLHNAAVHIRQRLHQCHKCGKSFTHRVNLWNHNKLVHLYPKRKRPMAKCTKCSETFIQKKQLRIHMNTVHQDPRPFKCSECEKSFAREVNLRHHIDGVHRNLRPHMCELCGKSFTSITSLNIHKTATGIHNPKPRDPKKFPCSKCEKSYSTRKILLTHIRYYHIRNGLKCDLCDKKYGHPQDLKRHVESFHEKIRHPCQVEGCGKTYTSERALKNHLRLEHSELPEAPKKYLEKCINGEDVFECKICGKQFKTVLSITSHVGVVHGPNFSKRVESFVCELCGYKTAYKIAFQKHMDSHNNGECVACEICNSQFNSTVALQMHIRSRHVLKELKCHVCDKMFKNQNHLNRHVSTIHEKKRIYCQVEGCDKNYSQETDLFKHYKSQHPDFAITKKSRKVSKYADMFTRRMENGESVFECKLCKSEKYKNRQGISLHIRNTHGRIEFKCQDCSFETVFKTQLEAHVRLTHKDRLGMVGDGESRPSLVLLV